MGRYYEGDIEGKFWFASMSSQVADCYGKGEFSYFCDKLEREVTESEKQKMSEEEQNKVDKVPSSIKYAFTDREKILRILKSKAIEAQALYGANLELCKSLLEKYGLSHKDSFIVSLVDLAEQGLLDTDYLAEKLYVAMFAMQYKINKIRAEDNQTEVFGEVFIGLQILMCIQAKGKCFFTGEL